MNPRRTALWAFIVTALALLREIGPLMSSSLILPGEDDPMVEGWQVLEELGSSLDAVVDSGDAGRDLTTIVDLSEDEVRVTRVGAGDPSDFEA